jgi:flagellar protein FliT
VKFGKNLVDEKKFEKFLSKTLKFPEPGPLKGDNRQSGRVFQSGAHMTSNEVLAMYENIAALTCRMAAAARDGDWNGFARTGVPALEGEQRKRKIDLLKQIMANDRAVRDITEPWMGQLDRAMSPAH